MGVEQMIKMAVIAVVVILVIVLLCVGYVKAPPDMAAASGVRWCRAPNLQQMECCRNVGAAYQAK